MKHFLIIDDNNEQSETVKSNIELELERLGEKDFAVLETFPFENPEDYFEFIDQKKVGVLILDEKLNDQADAHGNFAKYLGHDIVTMIRERYKDLPIYTITNFANDEDVLNVFSEYDQVISRKDFYGAPEKFVPVMLRAASKFVDRNSSMLSELTLLSQEIASGNSTEEKVERIKALQAAVELPLVGFADRQSWLDEYSKQLEDLKEINLELKKKLNK